MLPDYSALFHREKVRPLHFRVRGGSNFVHDIQFLSSYLHDGRFSVESAIIRGKTMRITIERDCWELGKVERPEASELYVAKARLTIGPISTVHWETNDPACLGRKLWIESIYAGAAHWETPGITELVISAPRGGWKIRVSIADDLGEIRLDDLETPHLYSQAET
ncbi:hypothetical protein EP7_002289 [Isosphaeraceae bacterium EP7]